MQHSSQDQSSVQAADHRTAGRQSELRANRVVLAITGASGSAYAVRLAQILLEAGVELHVLMSSAARLVLERELQLQAPPASGQSSSSAARFPGTAPPAIS